MTHHVIFIMYDEGMTSHLHNNVRHLLLVVERMYLELNMNKKESYWKYQLKSL
jgi:hypothetical protein